MPSLPSVRRTWSRKDESAGAITHLCPSSSCQLTAARFASGCSMLASTVSLSSNSTSTRKSPPGLNSASRKIASSISRLRRRSASSSSRASTTETKMSGWASTRSRIARDRMGTPGIGTVPMRSEPFAPLATTASACAAPRSSPKIATAWGAKEKPCTVGSTPCALRSKSLTPSNASSPATALVTAGCVMCSAAAALRKLRCSITATNTRSSPILRCLGKRSISVVADMALGEDRGMKAAHRDPRRRRASRVLVGGRIRS